MNGKIKNKEIRHKLYKAIKDASGIRQIGLNALYQTLQMLGDKPLPRLAPDRWNDMAIVERDLFRSLKAVYPDSRNEKLGNGIVTIPNWSNRIRWSEPFDNRGDTSMVAFNNKGGIRRRHCVRIMASVSKVVAGAFSPWFGQYRHDMLQRFVNWFASEVKSRWISCQDERNIVVVSGDPHAWEFAYRGGRPWYSCMADHHVCDDEWTKVNYGDFSKIALKSKHADFWRQQDPAVVKMAMLFDNGGNLLVRAALWNVDTLEGNVGYLDRQYFYRVADARVLINKLYKDGLIKYYREPGSECKDCYNIRDKENRMLSQNYIQKWNVVVNMDDDANQHVSYMDTFKMIDEFLPDGKARLIVRSCNDANLEFYDPRWLEKTELYLGGWTCRRCGTHFTRDDDYYGERDHPNCYECTHDDDDCGNDH